MGNVSQCVVSLEGVCFSSGVYFGVAASLEGVCFTWGIYLSVGQAKGCRLYMGSVSQCEGKHRECLLYMQLCARSGSVCFTWSFVPAAGVYLGARGAGRSADGQRLLGAVLPGARHLPGWQDALRQDHGRWRRLLQHLLQRDRLRQARAPRHLRGPGAHRCRSVGQGCGEVRDTIRVLSFIPLTLS